MVSEGPGVEEEQEVPAAPVSDKGFRTGKACILTGPALPGGWSTLSSIVNIKTYGEHSSRWGFLLGEGGEHTEIRRCGYC